MERKYKDGNNNVKVSVMLINNDLWLTQNLIAELFDTSRSTITQHINNIFRDGELEENNTVEKIDIDNSKKPVKIYNLDMIIAVGYRVNSKKATNFRIWATKVLKELEKAKKRIKVFKQARDIENIIVNLEMPTLQNN